VSKDGNSFTHYLVVDESILGEAFIVEKVSDWISLAFVRLGIGGPKPFTDYAFVENQSPSFPKS